MTWMVTGGAGYIGSHVVRAFEEVGLDVVVVDDLSSGHREFVPDDVPFVEGTILDTDLVDAHDARARRRRRRAPRRVQVRRRLGRAARCTPTSRTSPAPCTCSRRWSAAGVDKIVFSSSAAIYGTPDVDLVTEETADAARVAVRRVAS